MIDLNKEAVVRLCSSIFNLFSNSSSSTSSYNSQISTSNTSIPSSSSSSSQPSITTTQNESQETQIILENEPSNNGIVIWISYDMVNSQDTFGKMMR